MSNFVLGTAGHIDHGKTALVRALTGVDCDRLPEEKSRGITIDLGFAHLNLGAHRLALVDVPGHERFVRNMLAGATGLDLALLVVAADDSIMPQTREHLEILRILGLSGGAIALTKCDLVDSDWLDLVEADIRELTSGMFLEDAAIIRTSAATGQGIEDLRRELTRLCGSTPIREDSGLFRMAIDRSFTVPGHGAVATGTVASGSISIGDEIAWLPSGKTLRVKGLHSHDRVVERVGRGMRAAVNLAGAKHDELERGHQLAAPGYLEASKLLSVEVRASPDAFRGFRHRERYRLHIGTEDVLCALSLFGSNELGPGETAIGQLYLARPLAAVHGQPFVIRRISPVATLGGGRVLQPVARKVRRRDKSTIERLARLADSSPRIRLESALAFAGLRSWTERDLCRDTGIPIQETTKALERLSEDGGLIELPIGPRRTARIPALAVADLEDRVLRAIKRLHEARPRQSMVVRSHLTAALADLGSDALIHALIERLRSKNRVQADPRRVALTGHAPKLSQAERRLKEDLAKAIRDGGMSPPDLTELQAMAGPRANIVSELLQLLIEEERVAAIASTFFLDFETEAKARRVIAERLQEKGEAGLSMAELRDALGTTRKFAVPIGEHLDRVGVTVRDGDLRRLGPNFAF